MDKCCVCDVERTFSAEKMFVGDKYRGKLQCPKCKMIEYIFLNKAGTGPVAEQVKFDSKFGLKCETCEKNTDLLHIIHEEGQDDCMVCGTCKQLFDEAETSREAYTQFLA